MSLLAMWMWVGVVDMDEDVDCGRFLIISYFSSSSPFDTGIDVRLLWKAVGCARYDSIRTNK